MGYVDPIRFLSPRLQRYPERARAAGPFIPPKPKVPADFHGLPDASLGVGYDRARSLASINAIVCEVAGIAMPAFTGERNFPHVVRARHVAMWIANRDTGLSSPRIGRACGNRDHTTVCRAINRLDKVIALHGVDVPADVEGAARLLLSLSWPFNLRARRA